MCECVSVINQKFPKGKDATFQFYYLTHRLLHFHFIPLCTMPFNLNLIIILFMVLRSQQLELTSMACMYVIQDAISAAVLSGTYTATGRISELCKNGDFIMSLTI